MPKKHSQPAQKSLLHTLKKWVYPHEHNDHHPHAIRHQALSLYIAILLTFNIGYNLFVAHSNQVLGFATAISQQEIIRLTNVERAKAGAPTVTENTQLNQAAMLKAKNMFEEDYWAHYAPSGKSPWYWFDQAGYAYTLAGENLARDFDTSQGVINGWMNSPSHKANMLATGYKDIGIAVLNGVLGGRETTLVVQHFGTPVTIASNSTPSTQGAISNPPQQSPPVAKPQVSLQTAPSQATPVQDQTLIAQEQSPRLTGAAGIPFISPDLIAALPYQLLNPAPMHTWSTQQVMTVIFLLGLMLLFIFDFAVLHKKQIQRPHSHSLLHAGMMAVAVVVVLYSTSGGVL
jgi:uncharacterized protein YkwD